MSVNNEKKQEMLENEVVVNENESTALVEVTEPKKKKIPEKVKTGLKVAALTGLGVLLGYGLGKRAGKNDDDYYYDSDVIEGEVVDSEN